MENIKDSKVNRIIYIYDKLTTGNTVNKEEMASLFGVSKKTIQRDIEDIRFYFRNNFEIYEDVNIEYKKEKRGYHLIKGNDQVLGKEDILAITKILLESRAFCKDEMDHLINVILGQVDNKQRKCIKEIIGNELLNFVPLQHNKPLINTLWSLSEFIRHNEIIEVSYGKMNGNEVIRILKPVSIIFSEYYFYLIAYIEGKDYNFPAVYRVDRINYYKSTGEKFLIPESERFEDGEFRKRVQFMFPGKLMKIRFEYWGSSIEAVLERLPTARIISQDEGKYLFEAEVFGKGISMWILSQGGNIKVIYPKELVQSISEESRKIFDIYNSK